MTPNQGLSFSTSSLERWRSWHWSGPCRRSPLIAVWTNGSCRGATRPMTSSRIRGMLPTRLAFARSLHLQSPQLSELKKRVMKCCLLWMSQCTSAYPLPLDRKRRSLMPPNHVGQHLPSLDDLPPLPGRWLQLCTPWPCSRYFRPNSLASASPVLQLGLLRMRPLQHWLKP